MSWNTWKILIFAKCHGELTPVWRFWSWLNKMLYTSCSLQCLVDEIFETFRMQRTDIIQYIQSMHLYL